ncbi:MAG: hypothetical protein EOO47_25210, partial [Flavobacterium sp.]
FGCRANEGVYRYDGKSVINLKLKEIDSIRLSSDGSYLHWAWPQLQDKNGNVWFADQQSSAGKYGSSSWTANFPGVPTFFASQRRTFSPISGASDWKLFQSFRYGREQLNFNFQVPKDGEYLVELYFIEPWLGIGGGMNAEKMRLFDVAINNKTVIKDLDIWKEVGTNTILKKTVKIYSKAGRLSISFPQVKVGQAIISAIAIASLDKTIKVGVQSNSIADAASSTEFKSNSWMDIGDKQFLDGNFEFTSLPPNLYGAEWIQTAEKHQNINFNLNDEADVFAAVNASIKSLPEQLKSFEDTKTSIGF